MTNPYGPPQGQPNPYGQQPQAFGQQPGFGQQPQAFAPQSGGVPAQYGQQPSPYGAPGMGGPGMGGPGMGGPGMGGPGMGGDIHAIPDYKGWAIGSIFMCWIVAIFAIMKSNEVQTYKMQGNYAMAAQASKSTKTLCIVATAIFGVGCVFSLLWIIVAAASF